MKILAFCGEGIGNNILFTPAVQAMQALFPYVRVDVITKYPQIWTGMSYVKAIPGQKLAGSFYDVSIANIFDHPNFYSGITVGDSWPRPQLSYTEHEMVKNLEPIQGAGYDGPMPLQHVPLINMPRVLPTNRPVVAICDGSKPRCDCGTDHEYLVWKKKRWPHFVEFVERVLDEGIYVAAIGTGNDGPDLKGLEGHELLLDYRGQFSLLEVASILRQANVFVTTDCGPMHIGDAAGIRMLALFGPTSVAKNAPLMEFSEVLNAREIYGVEEPEQGTPEFGQRTDSPSMEALEPSYVLEKVKGLL